MKLGHWSGKGTCRFNIFLRKMKLQALHDFGYLVVKEGVTDGSGLLSALYGGNYFSSLTDEFEYDSPADHNFLSGVELRGAYTKLGSMPASKNMVDMLDLNLLMRVFHHLSENQETWVIKKRLELGFQELSTSVLDFGLSIDDYDYKFMKFFRIIY